MNCRQFKRRYVKGFEAEGRVYLHIMHNNGLTPAQLRAAAKEMEQLATDVEALHKDRIDGTGLVPFSKAKGGRDG